MMKTLLIFVIVILCLATRLSGSYWDTDYMTSGEIRQPEEQGIGSWGLIHDTGTCQITGHVYSDLEPVTLNLGSWKVPTCHVYDPMSPTPVYLENGYNEGYFRAEVRKGDYDFSLPSLLIRGIASAQWSSPWWLTDSAPLFGLPQISQKGDRSPYAHGGTIASAGCHLCSMDSIAQYLRTTDWDVHTLNSQMMSAGGYGGPNGRDIIPAVAARLLKLVRIGRFGWSISTIQKYDARLWMQTVRVAVPHRNDKGQLYHTQHWVAKARGATLKSSGFDLSMMDPALRCEYFGKCNYRPMFMDVYTTKSGYLRTIKDWWKSQPSAYSSPVKVSAIASVASSNWDNISSEAIAPTGLAQINAISNVGTFVQSVETPEFILTKENSGEVDDFRATLWDDAYDLEHDDEIEPDYSPEPIVELTNDHSEANILNAWPGPYKFNLTGSPNGSFRLELFLTDSNDQFERKILEGTMDSTGKGQATLDFNPGMTVLKLGVLRRYLAGLRLTTTKTVIGVGDGEFFIEDTDRSAGAKIVSTIQPPIGSRVTVNGQLAESSPEICILANETGVQMIGGGDSIQPLGMPGAWPKMANCLLSRISGRIISIDGTTAVIASGAGEITLTDIDCPVQVGNYLTVNAILRENRILKAVPGTCQVSN